jgi:peptidoglycan hydrolase-like protein with peptidoglycan-binding domain
MRYREPTDDENLALYTKGHRVKYAQELLQLRGHPPKDGQIDGFYGPCTEEAVREFQAANGLEPSGVLDSTTMDALHGAGGGYGGLVFAENPWVNDHWVVWRVRNTGGGVVPAGKSAGTVEVSEGSNVMASAAGVLGEDLQPGAESREQLFVDLLELAYLDGTYQASVHVGNRKGYVYYVVKDGAVLTQ